MLITDQLALVTGPRRLPALPFRMANAYTPRLREFATEVARERHIQQTHVQIEYQKLKMSIKILKELDQF